MCVCVRVHMLTYVGAYVCVCLCASRRMGKAGHVDFTVTIVGAIPGFEYNVIVQETFFALNFSFLFLLINRARFLRFGRKCFLFLAFLSYHIPWGDFFDRPPRHRAGDRVRP